MNDTQDLFPLLSDELVCNIMGKLKEEDLFVASQVCQRWSALAQDPHLFRQSLEGFREVRDLLSAAVMGAKNQLAKLKEAIVESYKDHSSKTVAIIQTRMDQKSEALCQKAASFGLGVLIEQIIGTFPTTGGTHQRGPHRTTFTKRGSLCTKLAKQITEFYVYLMVNQDVGEMQENPFVTISYRPDLLKAAKLVTDLLSISQASLDAAVVEGRSRYEAPLISWK